jgi:hypothetical protein
MKKFVPACLGVLALTLLSCRTENGLVLKRDAPPAPAPDILADKLMADYRYSPPWWQTAIGLPDDVVPAPSRATATRVPKPEKSPG